jgi:hypothetical protein
MIWFMVMQVVSTLIELVGLGHQFASEKDLEILLLRRQLAIYELGRYRRLSKDYEQVLENSEGMVYLASIHYLLKRLAPAH